MADSDAEADVLERLEAALSRIAVHAQASSIPYVDTAAVAARLDRLIGQLQDAVADDGKDAASADAEAGA